MSLAFTLFVGMFDYILFRLLVMTLDYLLWKKSVGFERYTELLTEPGNPYLNFSGSMVLDLSLSLSSMLS